MAVAEGFEPYSATWSLSGKHLRAAKTPIWRYRQLPLESPRLWAKSGQRRGQSWPYGPPGVAGAAITHRDPPRGRSAGCRRSQDYDTLILVAEQGGSLTFGSIRGAAGNRIRRIKSVDMRKH
jgi:hypothetical protein